MKRLLNPLYLAGLLAVSLLAVAIACGPAATPTPTPTPTRQATPTPTATAPVATSTPTPTAAPRPTATPTPTAVVGQTGKFTLGVRNVIPPLFVHPLGGVGHEDDYAGWGIVEFLIYANEKEEFDPKISLAESWQIAPDLSKVTFKIRKGISFHKGYGEVTAEDVVWSHNNALREGSKFWGITGIRQYMDRWEKVDDYTAVMYFKKNSFEPRWELALSNLRTHQPWVGSKKANDQLGEEKANTTAVGSGPYQALSYRSREKVELEALPSHWRRTAVTKRMDVVEIPEAVARAAAFQTGEVDVIEVDLKLIPDLQKKVAGSYPQPGLGYAFPHTIYWPGNYWADKNCQTGDTTGFPRPGFKPDAEHPWVGDPKNPARMESARKVRLAMATAIDSETILKTIFGGLGKVGGTYLGFYPTDPQYKKSWDVPYDAQKAKQLLTEAGYPSGFSFTFYVPPDHIVVNPEAGQAIAQMWRAIGLDPKIDSTAYAAARPRHFEGKDDIVWYHHTGEGDLDASKPGNWGPANTFHGVELPCDLQKLYWANRTEPDRTKRIANNVTVQDYASQWTLSYSFVTIVDYFMVGPKIKGWKPSAKPGLYFTNPETVEVRQ